MKSYTPQEVLARLYDDGWYKVGEHGNHLHLKHSSKEGRITVTQSKNQIPINTIRNIMKMSGIHF